MGGRWRTVVLLAVFVPTFGFSAPHIIDRTISSSRQFIVFAANRDHRNAISKKAEDIKRSVLHLLSVEDQWKHPIIIRLIESETYRKPIEPFQLSIHDAVDGMLRVQLDVNASRPVDTSLLERELLRAVLLEMMYRDEAGIAGKVYHYPPNWLMEALSSEIQNKDAPIDALLFAQLIKKGGAPRLEAFLQQNPARLDATSRAIYQAQALALLRVCMASRLGSQELLGYLKKNAFSESAKANLLSSFSVTNGSEEQLQRLWTLAIARYSATDRLDPLSLDETDQALSEILNAPFPNRPKKSAAALPQGPATFPVLARRKDSKIFFQTMESDLLRLDLRAHPLYRPIIQQYIALIQKLIANKLILSKISDDEKHIAEIEAARKIIRERMTKITDYLNWYEATKMSTRSHEFDVILKNAARYDSGKSQTPNPISSYLDDVEDRSW
ncbi:MAG: hypothetical protein ABI443_04685 [Chthoniobacterales bacterium]